jgi:DNA-binding NarL/FixJ family response regulator
MDKISVLIADDHPLVRDSISYLLRKHDEFEVIAEAGDGEEAVRLAGEHLPDVVILDIEMPKVDGLEATRQIKSSYPEVAVLVLTIHDDEEFVEAMFEAGAAGYLLKSVYGEELLQAIRAVKLGEFVLDSSIGSRVLRKLTARAARRVSEQSPGSLSDREIEVMKLVAQGMTNDEITSSLGISLNTVKRHLMKIFSKLGAGSRAEALVVSLRSGILSMEDLS